MAKPGVSGRPGTGADKAVSFASKGQKLECPPYLSQEANAEWKWIVEASEEFGTLNNLDVSTLAAYCEAVSTFRQSTRLIQEEGLTHESRGRIYLNPAYKAQNDASRQIATLGNLLGLSPAARARMSIEKADDDDEMAGILD